VLAAAVASASVVGGVSIACVAASASAPVATSSYASSSFSASTYATSSYASSSFASSSGASFALAAFALLSALSACAATFAIAAGGSCTKLLKASAVRPAPFPSNAKNTSLTASTVPPSSASSLPSAPGCSSSLPSLSIRREDCRHAALKHGRQQESVRPRQLAGSGDFSRTERLELLSNHRVSVADSWAAR
jgi:hypothetical protein